MKVFKNLPLTMFLQARLSQSVGIKGKKKSKTYIIIVLELLFLSLSFSSDIMKTKEMP